MITVAEYLRLHDLDPDLELRNGYWDDMYLLKPGTNVSVYKEVLEAEKARVIAEAKAAAAAVGLGTRANREKRKASEMLEELEAMRGVSMYEMANEEWDTVPLVRVDDVRALKGYDPGSWRSFNRSYFLAGTGALPNEKSQSLLHALNNVLTASSNANPNGQVVLQVDQARRVAKNVGFEDVDGDEGLERVLGDAGWDFVYTFEGRCVVLFVRSVWASFLIYVCRLNQEFIKAIVWPLTEVAPRAQIRGLVNELGARTEEVVHLAGEVHLERKAVRLVSCFVNTH